MNGFEVRRPTVLIYKKRILRWAETFIAQQARTLTRYVPAFAGLEPDDGGAAMIAGIPRVLLADHHPWPRLGRALMELTHRVPRRWRRAIAAQDPQLVHAHFGSQAHNGHAIAAALGIPLVVTYHGADASETPRSAAGVAHRRRAFRYADHNIAVSEFLAGCLRSAGCPADRITVHYIGVDTTRFAPGADPRDPATVLFVGRLVRLKGVHHLLHAMVAVHRAVPGVSLLIAGDGPLRQTLEAEARQLRIPARFLGVQDQDAVRALMRRATVLVGPSIHDDAGHSEGLPVTFLEAQACGLPVVVSRSGGTAEGVNDGESGLLFAPGDEGALTSHLLRVLQDAALRERMGRAARALMERRFDLVTQTGRLEAIYDRVRETAQARPA